jgi:hypothetical protein
MFEKSTKRKVIKKTNKFLEKMDCSVCDARCDMHCLVMFLQNQLRKLKLAGGKQFDYENIAISIQSNIDILRQHGINGFASNEEEDLKTAICEVVAAALNAQASAAPKETTEQTPQAAAEKAEEKPKDATAKTVPPAPAEKAEEKPKEVAAETVPPAAEKKPAQPKAELPDCWKDL